MKSLVVYYSMTGNCEMVAGKIAEHTGADVLRLEPVKAYPDSGFSFKRPQKQEQFGK